MAKQVAKTRSKKRATKPTNFIGMESPYRGASTVLKELALYRPTSGSADSTILRDSAMLRARARDLERNNAYALNAVRMRGDAVAGSGVKLALKPDWRMLGITPEVCSDWVDEVTREWETYADSSDCACDARRQATFSQFFRQIDRTLFVEGEALGIFELKKSDYSPYQTCFNLIDIDRLSNPNGQGDTATLRGGIELDQYGEPVAYWIQNSHPNDYYYDADRSWRRIVRRTPWGRPIALHLFQATRAEASRGVSEFAAAIVPMRMHGQYSDMELQSAIVHAMYAAVIESTLDYNQAANVMGAEYTRKIVNEFNGNPITALTLDHLRSVSPFHREAGVTMDGVKIPHLIPNEELKLLRSEHPNSNFDAFDAAFIRQFAAALGVENHELAKNYSDVNYSAARTALSAAWRTYTMRRQFVNRGFGMPFFCAWLEEAIAIGQLNLPAGVKSFLENRNSLCRGRFISWGKPLIDPTKERKGQAMGLDIGVDTLEDICADEGNNYRDILDQRAAEKRYKEKLGLTPEDLMSAAPSGKPGGNDFGDPANVGDGTTGGAAE